MYGPRKLNLSGGRRRRTRTTRRRMRGRGILDSIRNAARGAWGFIRGNAGRIHDFIKDKKLLSQGLNYAASQLPGNFGRAAGFAGNLASQYGYGRRRRRQRGRGISSVLKL